MATLIELKKIRINVAYYSHPEFWHSQLKWNASGSKKKNDSGSKVPKHLDETWNMKNEVSFPIFCLLSDKHVIFTDLAALKLTWKAI